MDTKAKLLTMRGINKKFLGVPVLKGVNFELDYGEIISIVGSNGAGKSTLSNMVSGVLQPDDGEIRIDGNIVHIHSPNEAEVLSIGMVHQEPTLCENMKGYENIFLNREIMKIFPVMDREKMRRQSREVLDFLGFEIDVDKNVQEITLVGKVVVSIAKAMLMNPKILILDEVTATLNSKEVDHLFEIVAGLREKGIGIIYISHNIREIVKISDKVAVLKDGMDIGVFDSKLEPLDEKKIIARMLGDSDWSGKYKEKVKEAHSGKVLMQVKNLGKKGLYSDISFDLHAVEIIGLSGVKGAGITEFMYSVFGIMSYDSGGIILRGSPFKAKSPQDAVENNICMITNDRQKEGLALSLSNENNITITTLQGISGRWGVLDPKKSTNVSERYIQKLQIKTTGPAQPVQYLSGGNQQKVVLAKWLLRDMEIILIDEPTRGIDVRARNEIYNLLLEQRAQGKGLVVFSPETRELLNICNRILVVDKGRLIREIHCDQEEFTEKGLMEAIHAY